MKINFEINKEESLTEWQRKELLEGIDQADKGDFLTDIETKEIWTSVSGKVNQKGFVFFC